MTMYNLEGEIDELRISKVMRFPVTDKLAIIRQKLPDAGLKIPYKSPTRYGRRRPARRDCGR